MSAEPIRTWEIARGFLADRTDPHTEYVLHSDHVAELARVRAETIKEVVGQTPEPYMGLWLTSRQIDTFVRLARREGRAEALREAHDAVAQEPSIDNDYGPIWINRDDALAAIRALPDYPKGGDA